MERKWRRQPIKAGWHWIWDLRDNSTGIVRIDKIEILGFVFREGRLPMECANWTMIRFQGPLTLPTQRTTDMED